MTEKGVKVKRLTAYSLIFLVTLLSTNAYASEGTYLNDAVRALKDSPVYVAPETPGTNTDTSGELAAQLTPEDDVLIVMLPPDALAETDGDIKQFAEQLDDATGNSKIIGLAVGDQLIGHSAVLPVGKAAELMNRAKNVTHFTVERLAVYVSNVHDWQAQNPDATASKPANPAKKEGGFPWWIVPAALFIAIAIGAVYAVSNPRKFSQSEEADDIKFRSPVREDLERLAELRPLIHDESLRSLLRQVCIDVEAYFDKYCANPEEDSGVFRNHLSSLRKVLEKYADIQNSPSRYYDNPEKLMADGYAAVDGFEQFVLRSIKRGAGSALTEFHVDTDILSAQKYS